MPILLDNRNRENEVRESIVQQPAPFSSIWANSTGFWRNPSPEPAGAFDFSPPPPPIEVLRFPEPRRVFVFGANLNAPSGENASSDNPRRVEQVGAMFQEMRIESEAKIPEPEGFSKGFTVGIGAQGGYHQPVNPRPRFSKLRKSTHQGKGKGLAATGGAPFPFDESPAPAPTPAPFTFRASCDSTNFHTGEPSSNDEKKAAVSAEEAEPKPEFLGEDPGVFIFTAMRDSVSGIPEAPELSEEAELVAENLNDLKLGNEGEESSGSKPPPFVFGASPPAPEPAVDDSSFVFRGEVEDASFVFKAFGDARKMMKSRRISSGSRVKQARSRSSSGRSSDDSQGSPMDFSPCPDVRDPPSPAASEAKASEEAEVEHLRAAAAELNLGNEELKTAGIFKRDEEEQQPQQHEKEEDEERSESFMFGRSGSSFSFTSSSAEPPRRRPQRRVLKGKSSSTRSRASSAASSREGFEIEFDGGKAGGVWSGQQPQQAQMMDFLAPSGAPSSASRGAVEQACEKWRLRGNQAYANGDFPKAEEYYSRGASSVSSNETSQSCIHASMLCYSNRAATRMVVGRMREALADCKRAISVDPNFLRVRLRAGSCCLALGESESAATYFQDCLYRVRDHDLKIASEASDGLRKTQQAQDFYKRVWDLVSEKDFAAALRLVNEALVISPFSEALQELKARCLVSIRRFDEAVETCEQTLVLAESNWPADPPSQLIPGFQPRNSPKVWRSWVISKALFYTGRLEDSADSLQKLADLLSLCGTNKISQVFDADIESFSQFNALLHGLLRHKAAGNEAFQAGRHTEAVENYTAALACNSDARPFNAVLFCNRAAAYQALGHIADAIADSSRAVVLDSNYAKAISRRATLHTLIRDYGQACIDLRRLTSLLEKQAKDNPRKASQDLKQAHERLASAEEELKKSHPIDHYAILGLESSSSAVDIKKAYRKLALRHHPDKAGQLLQRSDVSEDSNWWKEATEEIRNDAERLFKLIGEAYAILSDPSKRSRYDSDEELRKLRTRSGMNPAGSEKHGYHSHERSGRRQRDPWTGYTHQQQRWQNGPDAAQPDTYARYFRTSSGVRSTDYNWDDL